MGWRWEGVLCSLLYMRLAFSDVLFVVDRGHMVIFSPVDDSGLLPGKTLKATDIVGICGETGLQGWC